MVTYHEESFKWCSTYWNNLWILENFPKSLERSYKLSSSLEGKSKNNTKIRGRLQQHWYFIGAQHLQKTHKFLWIIFMSGKIVMVCALYSIGHCGHLFCTMYFSKRFSGSIRLPIHLTQIVHKDKHARQNSNFLRCHRIFNCWKFPVDWLIYHEHAD